jgi:exodeoxyribonuclease V alpha subunit
MSAQPYFSAFGTARLLYRGTEDLTSDQQSYEDFLLKLSEGIRAYSLEDEVVHIARELVSFLPNADIEMKKTLVILALCVIAAVRQGSTFLSLHEETIVPCMRTLLGHRITEADPNDKELEDFYSRIKVFIETNAARAVIGVHGEFKPLIVDLGGVYLERFYRLEIELCERLAFLVQNLSIHFKQNDEAEGLQETERQLLLQLTEGQKQAISEALTHSVSIISGGPGTGKTSIVVSLLSVLQLLGLEACDIVLAAPTGKAAQRLTTSVREVVATKSCILRSEDLEDAKTLHRLLRYSPSRDVFLHGKQFRLSGKVFIIDEASMIDLVLMHRLLSALPDQSLLILIGDADQLPAVDAGAVFAELVPFVRQNKKMLPFGYHCLTENFRMREDDPEGKQVLMLADTIRLGAADKIFNAVPPMISTVSDLDEYSFAKTAFWDITSGDSVVAAFLDGWYRIMINGLPDFYRLVSKRYYYGNQGFSEDAVRDISRLFTHFDQFKILCVTNIYASGVDAINRIFHMKVLQREGFERPVEFAPGEPVLMDRNDYSRNIFNGEQGLILRVVMHKQETVQLMAVFKQDNTYVAYPIDSMRGNLSLAYAVSVHRSQGMEFTAVALLLPEQDMKILTREILYTAVTRAQKKVLIVGRKDIFIKGIQNREQRMCGVGKRLLQLATSSIEAEDHSEHCENNQV